MKIALLALPFLLTACEAIGNWADDTGRNLPVADERCDYWQCITEEGQRKDVAKKRAIAEKEKAAQKKAADKPTVE